MNSTITVLALEDDSEFINLIKNEFEKIDLQAIFETVQTKADFELKLSKRKPDIILSNFNLPSCDGLTALLIRQRLAPHVPFLILTNAANEESVCNLLTEGITDYLIKEKKSQFSFKIKRAITQYQEFKDKEAINSRLAQGEVHLQKVLGLSLDIICTVDEEGIFTTISPASKLVLDYLPEELIGKGFVDLVHQDCKAKAATAILNLKYGIDIINLETPYQRKSGEWVVLLWSIRWDEEDNLGYGIGKDITEIKRTEEKIRRSENKFKALLENITDGITLVNADGMVLERNTSSKRIIDFGFEEPDGKFRFDLIHPADLPAVFKAFNLVKQNLTVTPTIEARFLMPNGEYKWFEGILYNQLQNPDVEAIILTYRDITERKISELKIQKSEAKLKEAQSIGQVGSWELDFATGNLIWSDEIYRMLGIDKTEVTPTFEKFLSFLHPDDLPTFSTRWEQIKGSQENGSINLRIVQPNGNIRHVSLIGHFEFDGNRKISKIVGIQQDITARVQTEEALAKSEEKYRYLFNYSPIPMWIFDPDTLAFLDVNEAAITHYGYSKEEFLTMNLRCIRPSNGTQELEEITSSLRKTKGDYKYTTRHQKKNGEIFPVNIKTSLIQVGIKEVRLTLAIDVSETMDYIHKIESYNKRLREIAWFQSHVVRAPLARLMGIVNLIINNNLEESSLKELVSYLIVSAYELDGIIRDIVKKTEMIEEQKLT